MYSSLLAKQQFKIITSLWQKQQLQLLTACVIKSTFQTGASNKNYATTISKSQNEKELNFRSTLNQKGLHQDGSQDKLKQGKQLEISETEDEANIYSNGDEIDSGAQNFNFKQLLYTEGDVLLDQLNSCESLKQLESVLKAKQSYLQKEHIVQSIILLWMFNRQSNLSFQQPLEQKIIEFLMPILNKYVPILNINEMSTSYLYLRKMGVENTNPEMQKILTNALHEIEHSGEVVCLAALSRLVVGINTGRDFFTPMLCANFLRHLKHHVENCASEDEARMISICMFNLQVLISNDLIELYKQESDGFISFG
ncbi:hypothetical protein DOY81_011615 [Sarcophaga bullata]|nr:hypothetical protein DOY81_011615 [Sarcophaga bullata]